MKNILLMFMLLPTFLFSQTAEDSLTMELSKLCGDSALIGYGVAIVNMDSVLYSRGFGFSDQKKKTPYTINTVQRLASISKTLLGVSLMKAQELNLLELDDDINDYLPFRIANPYFPEEKISIRQVANHTSGLKDTRYYEKAYIFDSQLPKFQKKIPFGLTRLSVGRMVRMYNRNIEIPQKEFLHRIYATEGKWYRKRNFIKNHPGNVFEYSNNGAALASIIIEEASGMSYIEFTRKYISAPLGMTSSGWDLNNYPEDDKAKLYPLGMEIPEYNLITLADGAFITSIEDFSKYLMAVIKGYNGEDNIITSESYSKMLKENILNNSGVFWSVKELDNSNYIGHGGFDPGIQTQIFFDKRNGVGYLFFTTTNTFTGEQGKAITAMIEYYSSMDSVQPSQKGSDKTIK